MERDGQVEDFTVKQEKFNLGIKNHKLVGPYWEGFPSYQTCEANLFNVHILLDLLGIAPLSWPPCSHPANSIGRWLGGRSSKDTNPG